MEKWGSPIGLTLLVRPVVRSHFIRGKSQMTNPTYYLHPDAKVPHDRRPLSDRGSAVPIGVACFLTSDSQVHPPPLYLC